jgi:predicted dehydrogenase
MQKVKIGIGAGWWATENHIPPCRASLGLKLPASAGLGQKELRAVEDRFAIPFGTGNYEDLFVLSGLDGVVISTPHHLHFAHASAALERRLPVVCEQSMVLRASQAWKLAELANSRKLHLFISYGWNYAEYAWRQSAVSMRGKIAKMEHVHCHMASALPHGSRRKCSSNPRCRRGATQVWAGASLHGQLSHALGLLLYFTGLQTAEVFALTGVSPTGADLFNSICCRFKNGATEYLEEQRRCLRGLHIKSTSDCSAAKECCFWISNDRVWKFGATTDRTSPCHCTMNRNEPGAYDCINPLRTFVGLIRGEAV